MRGLQFFTKRSVQGSWNIVSWHSPHSLTWRWLFGFNLFRGDEARVRPLWWSYGTNNGLQWGFRIPFIGTVRFSQQRPMWYRDLYTKLRDKHDEPLAAPPPNPAPPSLTVIDGGASIH